MRYFVMIALAMIGLALLVAGREAGEQPDVEDLRRPAPEFPTTATEDWFNSPPLRMADLRGQVVLLEIWTFG